jgi:hypothetical protein
MPTLVVLAHFTEIVKGKRRDQYQDCMIDSHKEQMWDSLN